MKQGLEQNRASDPAPWLLSDGCLTGFPDENIAFPHVFSFASEGNRNLMVLTGSGADDQEAISSS
ncbi:MAG: hypothetical protein QM308_02115 [Bacillota bacterium]|nr:hypothetical protein [Bacillota bacterium]